MKTLKLDEEQLSLLKDIICKEGEFLKQLEFRIEVGFCNDISDFSKKAKESISNNMSIVSDLMLYKKSSFEDSYYNYIINVVKMHYAMQCQIVNRIKNNIWWTLGKPDNLSFESLEEDVPEDEIEKRNNLKTLLESLEFEL